MIKVPMSIPQNATAMESGHELEAAQRADFSVSSISAKSPSPNKGGTRKKKSNNNQKRR